MFKRYIYCSTEIKYIKTLCLVTKLKEKIFAIKVIYVILNLMAYKTINTKIRHS